MKRLSKISQKLDSVISSQLKSFSKLSRPKRILGGLSLFLIALSIFFTVSYISQPTELRSKAADDYSPIQDCYERCWQQSAKCVWNESQSDWVCSRCGLDSCASIGLKCVYDERIGLEVCRDCDPATYGRYCSGVNPHLGYYCDENYRLVSHDCEPEYCSTETDSWCSKYPPGSTPTPTPNISPPDRCVATCRQQSAKCVWNESQSDWVCSRCNPSWCAGKCVYDIRIDLEVCRQCDPASYEYYCSDTDPHVGYYCSSDYRIVRHDCGEDLCSPDLWCETDYY